MFAQNAVAFQATEKSKHKIDKKRKSRITRTLSSITKRTRKFISKPKVKKPKFLKKKARKSIRSR